MSLFQAFLCGLLYFLAQSNVTMVSYGTIYRPLVNGWLVGCILGDPVMGVSIGATINMMFIGFISAGGSLPSDIPMAGILGTALAISAGLDVDAALALAVPLGLLGAFTWVGRLTLDSFFNPLTEKIIEKNDSLKGLWIPTVILPQLFLFCITCIPVTIAAYFGSQVVGDFLNSVAFLVPIMSVVGGLMPALGIGITLKFIFQGESRVFLFLGFLLAAYTNLPMIGIGLIALISAIIYIQITSKIEGAE